MKKQIKAKEIQNQGQLDIYSKKGPTQLGPWTSHIWRTDPRHLGFLLARYKFCAKMLAGKSRVVEIGCGDAFGMPIVLQTVDSILGVDFEPLVIEDAKRRMETEECGGGGKKYSFLVMDITQQPLTKEEFDGAYSLDVIEHIPAAVEGQFIKNICSSLKEDAVLIIGTPNLEAQKFASPASKVGHINLKNAETLRKLLMDYCYNVFIFSMNDEIVHTGFYPMAHYLLAMGVGVKK